MTSPWKKITEPEVHQNLADIMSEEIARGLQVKEDMKFAETISDQHLVEIPDTPETMVRETEGSECHVEVLDICDSDAEIAKRLQDQFDAEYDQEIKLVEKKKNAQSKVSLSYEKYLNLPRELVYDTEPKEVVEQKDWDRFETNEKVFASLPKRGYVTKEGEKVTKHDSVINGRRNASKVMSFPPGICTGDGAAFDMKLSNSAFNGLKSHLKKEQSRKHRMLDRKESHATAEMGMDEKTKLLIYKLINKGMLEKVNGIISTGKESIVIHANCQTSYPDMELPKECAIKVFKTTLNEFKRRDQYIEDDYRFKDRFSKQNPRKIVHMWAEKEMHNLNRLKKIGINCPDVICLKKHILVMSFIGHDNKPGLKLKTAVLKPEVWESVYNEVVAAIHKIYTEGHLVHADLSEYNILWYDNKCWIIDVSQSVQPDHPHAMEFLMRDCTNIYNFFTKKEVPNVMSAKELFKSITGIEDVDINMLDGVHPVYNPLSSRFEIGLDDDRNSAYPFNYCWDRLNDKAECSIKPLKEDEDSDDSDEFLEMWDHSLTDKAADFGNEIAVTDGVDVDHQMPDESIQTPQNDNS